MLYVSNSLQTHVQSNYKIHVTILLFQAETGKDLIKSQNVNHVSIKRCQMGVFHGYSHTIILCEKEQESDLCSSIKHHVTEPYGGKPPCILNFLEL
jgi:hypothetical protein